MTLACRGTSLRDMPRMPRLVVPGLPHHVTQRGVRSARIFADDADRETYLGFLRREGGRWGARYVAWCLMANHVHLIAIPEREESLARAIGEAHKRYTREINFRDGVRGHFFQGRFGSCVLDEEHLLAAARYVELNPVAAGVVEEPADYEWSSAAFHLGKRKADALVSDEDRALLGLMPDHRAWRQLLADGVDEIAAKRIEKHLSTGRPLGGDGFVRRLEKRTGRNLVAQKGGWPRGKPRGRRRRSN